MGLQDIFTCRQTKKKRAKSSRGWEHCWDGKHQQKSRKSPLIGAKDHNGVGTVLEGSLGIEIPSDKVKDIDSAIEECTSTKLTASCTHSGICFNSSTKDVNGIDFSFVAEKAEGPGIASGIDNPSNS